MNLRSVPNYWNISSDDYPARVYPVYDALAGKCVKLYGSQSFGIVTTDLALVDLFTSLDITFVIDESSPQDLRGVPTYSAVWGIWDVVQSGRYRIIIRKIDPFPDLQQPIEDDGFFMVGPEYDISQGQWKSLWPPGTIDNCYWARTDPNTGSIKENHFGQAGTYVRLYDTDLFESDDCAPWVFVAP